MAKKGYWERKMENDGGGLLSPLFIGLKTEEFQTMYIERLRKASEAGIQSGNHISSAFTRKLRETARPGMEVTSGI